MSKQSFIIKNLKSAANCIPQEFRANRQFVFHLEFIENNELELALDSLIELIDETNFKAPKEFWQFLFEAAKEMQLNEQTTFLNKLAK